MLESPQPSANRQMRAVLVVGANRGIGLQLMRTFKTRKWFTIGSIRPETRKANDASVSDLEETASYVLEIDYKDEETIRKAANNLRKKLNKEGISLEVLINCGGIKVGPLEWDKHEEDDLMERFRVMVVGPFLVTKHFLPLIKQHGSGKLIYITSDSGSIESPEHDGEVIGYRMAKAAANQQVRTLSKDFKRDQIPVSTLAFEPGFVATRLTGGRGNVCIKESCTGMVNIIEEMTKEMSGSFLNWKNETIPW